MIINILKVVDVTSPHSTLPCIRVKVVDKFVIPPDLLGPESIPDLERSNILFLHNAVNHARFMSSVFDVETYKLPKYSFNPGRVMLHKIFFKNTDGKFESVITSDDLSKNKSTKLDKPRKIIINDNSEIIKQAGDKEVIFVRCFFSKKWLLSHTIFADGYILDPLTYEEVPDYLDKSNIDLSRIASIVHEVEFNGKYKILATADSNLSTIRPIYKSATGGYSSFKLNNFDMFLINKISVVNP